MVSEKQLHYEILDPQRKVILPQLIFLKERYYLAGGTALALQIGHRKSEDFDYFTDKPFVNSELFGGFELKFSRCDIEKTQDSKDTLSFILDREIKFSFFRISYPPIGPLIDTRYFCLLSQIEIGAMKIIALTRAAYRDYVDIYFILQNYSLKEIFKLARLKYRNFDEGIYLKCLLSYEDVEVSPIKFNRSFKRAPKEVYSFIERKTKEYIRSLTKG